MKKQGAKMETKGKNADMEIVKVAVKDIKPYKNNAKKHPKEQVENVAESIRTLGWRQPIVLDKDNVIIIGHGRWLAAKKLKLDVAPCHYALDLTEEETRKLRLLDNKLNESEWDFDLLKLDMEGLDFGDMNLDWGLGETETKAEVVEDTPPQVDEENPPLTKLGDIWQLGEHRLMCGDSTDADTVGRLMNGENADLIMTDPPYGINAEKMTMGAGKKDFHRGNWDDKRPDIRFVLDLAKNVCIWGGNYYADILPVTNNWLCWHKKNDGRSFSEFELAWTNYGKNCRHISHHWGNEEKMHVTMKPLTVIAWAIKQVQDSCNIVLDLFGGSGSTLIACEQLNRKCFMMELDPKYCDVIIKRWETLTGKKAVKL